ncbi:MAG: hypothetical protein P4M02_04570 [Clostridia bacterium]|nr:hypothetical protein [Clostridia bacterium]
MSTLTDHPPATPKWCAPGTLFFGFLMFAQLALPDSSFGFIFISRSFFKYSGNRPARNSMKMSPPADAPA